MLSHNKIKYGQHIGMERAEAVTHAARYSSPFRYYNNASCTVFLDAICPLHSTGVSIDSFSFVLSSVSISF